MVSLTVVFLVLSLVASGAFALERVSLPERQLTDAAKSHSLDDNDNFSADMRFLCYDTRETVGPGIEHGTTIEVLELDTGRSIVLYAPGEIVAGDAPAPGVGAVSFSLAVNEVAFIHGPPVSEVATRGAYARSNRTGGRVILEGEIVERDGALHMFRDGGYAFSWLDKRDIETHRDTLRGAHRGGTHRHEFAVSGKRIGFTYDDHLLPQYDRTVGYMEPSIAAPEPATHFFAVLTPVAPQGESGPGELEKAFGDSWVDPAGTMRAFIGKVRNEDGATYEESLFVVDIPADVDITTADSGNGERFPTPPAGTTIRRLTHDWAGGIVRGCPQGECIAYYGKDADGIVQLFVIPAMGSDIHDDPLMRPVQVTRLNRDAEGGLRWHPSGEALLCVSDGGLVLTCVKPGPDFGRSLLLTARGDAPARFAPVVAPNGRKIAYNRQTPTRDGRGEYVKNYADEDFIQIFMVELPVKPGCDGIPGWDDFDF